MPQYTFLIIFFSLLELKEKEYSNVLFWGGVAYFCFWFIFMEPTKRMSQCTFVCFFILDNHYMLGDK